MPANMLQMLGASRRGAVRPLSFLQTGPSAVAQAAPAPQLIDPLANAQQFNFSGLYGLQGQREARQAEQDAKDEAALLAADEDAKRRELLFDAYATGQIDEGMLQRYDAAPLAERAAIADLAFDPLAGVDPATAAQLDFDRSKDARLGSEFDQQLELDRVLAEQDAEQVALENALARDAFGLDQQRFGLDERQLAQEGELAAREIDLKRALAANDAPAAVRTLHAMNVDPSSPEGQKILTDTLTGSQQGRAAAQTTKRVGEIDETLDAQNRALGALDQIENTLGDAPSGALAGARTEVSKIADLIPGGRMVLGGVEGLTGTDFDVDVDAAQLQEQGIETLSAAAAKTYGANPTEGERQAIKSSLIRAEDTDNVKRRKAAVMRAQLEHTQQIVTIESDLLAQQVPQLEARRQARQQAGPAPTYSSVQAEAGGSQFTDAKRSRLEELRAKAGR